MNKIKAFTDSERQQYSPLYVDLIMNMEEIRPFLSDEELQSRFFTRKVHQIKAYLDALDQADQQAEGGGLLEFLKSDDKYKDEVLKFKATLSDDLTKLQKCHQCHCSKCTATCPFKSCHYCSYNNHVVGCDQQRYTVTTGHPSITLYSNDEDRDVHFRTIGLLKDDFSDKQYIYLVETTNKENQHILEYRKYVDGTKDYLPIDEELLDKVYDLFVGFNCYE
ncbi:MAG: hypothetical protein ACRCW2_06315 [Cellulosilyticaceae bacterium]